MCATAYENSKRVCFCNIEIIFKFCYFGLLIGFRHGKGIIVYSAKIEFIRLKKTHKKAQCPTEE